MATPDNHSDADMPSMPDPGGSGGSSAGDEPPEPPHPSRSTRLPPVAPPEGADPGDVNARRALASDLLQIGAVALSPDDPFRWSSGMASPVYCDNRMTLGFPRVRSAICDGFHHVVTSEVNSLDVIAGTATAGIPHAAWLADRLNLPMAYVRGAAKSHGQKNRIEGTVERGDRVLLIEDLISTGGSALSAAEALQEVGATVTAVCAIFTYELDVAVQAFEDAAVPLHTLTDFSTLLDVARREHDLSESEVASLEEWRNDPQAWSTAHGGA